MGAAIMKPKILFVYDHKTPEYWMDGLWAALQVLQKDFDVEKWNLAEKDADIGLLGAGDKYDFMLGWGGFNSKVDKRLQEENDQKKGLCIGGNAFPPTGANNYDVLFFETKWYRPQISFHKNIVLAFGVNTDIFFQPDITMPIVWDYIGVGAFAKWKRWEKMKLKKGNCLVVGEIQSDNKAESREIYTDLIENGVMVSDMVSPFDISNMYHWSRTLYMPSDIYGGGERSVLEARACGLQVEIEPDNDKLKELLTCPIPSHVDYANKLREGILSVL